VYHSSEGFLNFSIRCSLLIVHPPKGRRILWREKFSFPPHLLRPFDEIKFPSIPCRSPLRYLPVAFPSPPQKLLPIRPFFSLPLFWRSPLMFGTGPPIPGVGSIHPNLSPKFFLLQNSFTASFFFKASQQNFCFLSLETSTDHHPSSSTSPSPPIPAPPLYQPSSIVPHSAPPSLLIFSSPTKPSFSPCYHSPTTHPLSLPPPLPLLVRTPQVSTPFAHPPLLTPPPLRPPLLEPSPLPRFSRPSPLPHNPALYLHKSSRPSSPVHSSPITLLTLTISTLLYLCLFDPLHHTPALHTHPPLLTSTPPPLY